MSRARRRRWRRVVPVAAGVALAAVAAWALWPEQPGASALDAALPRSEGTPRATPGSVQRLPDEGPGSVAWTLQGAEEFRGSATLDRDGFVYVGNESGVLRKLHPQTGETVWAFDCCADQPTPELDPERGQECNVDSTPAIDADGDVWVGCWNGSLVQLSPDGVEKCRHLAQDEVSSSPAIAADGTVYVGSEDRKLWAISGDDCSVRWQHHFPDGSVYGAPAVTDRGMVVSTSADDHVYAWNPDGSPRWRVRTGFDVYSSAALGADGTIYVGSGDHHLYALTPDGQIRWTVEARGRIDTSPAVGPDGAITFGSWDGRVYQVEPDGRIRWTVETGDEVWSSPVIGADGTVYIGSNDDHVWAIGAGGEVLWRTRLDGDLFASPALGDDGLLYVGTHGGRFFALRTDSPGVADAPWPQFKGGPLRRSHACGGADWACPCAVSACAAGADGDPCALEACNGEDDDCDGAIDEGAACPSCGAGTCEEGPTTREARCVDGACERTCAPGFTGQRCEWPVVEAGGGPGTVAWVAQADDAVLGAAALDPQTGDVLVGSADFALRRLAPDGTERCRFETLYGVHGRPLVTADGVAWFGGEDQHLYGVGRACEVVCALPLLGFAQGANIPGRPAELPGGDLVFGAGDGQLYRLDRGACEARPLLDLGGTIYGGPLVVGGVVVQGSYAGALVAVDPATGAPVWSAADLGKLHGAAVSSADGEALYATSRDGRLVAVDAASGAARWTRELGDEAWASPALLPDGGVVVGAFDGRVRAFEPDGAERWSADVGGGVRGAAWVDAAGSIYVATDHGDVVALDAAGVERWRAHVGAPILGPGVVGTPDGLVVVGTRAGAVVALRR